MGLFNKKLSLEEILKAIANLSDEEKAKVKEMVDTPIKEESVEKPEEIENETQTEGTESVEPTEEVEETTEVEGEIEQPTEEVDAPTEEQPVEETPAQPEVDQVAEDNKEEVLQGLVGRISSLEEKLAQFDELKGLMEEYTKKQADSFGYKGAIPGVKKDINEMSASELKQKMLNGEI